MNEDLVLRLAVGVALASLASCNGHPKPACDPTMLTMQLSTALPGATVMVGACEVTGNFTVPAGVMIAGVDRVASVVHATSGAALTLTPGAMPTGISELTVRADGAAGITVSGTGSGDVTLDRINVHATHGYAIGVEGIATLTVTDVALDGPITSAAMASTLVSPVSPTVTATHGLVVVNVANAMLSTVSTTGFAAFGAAFAHGTVAHWMGGNASRDVGTGVLVDGATLTLDTVDIVGTYAGTGSAYGVVTRNMGSIVTSHVSASNNEGFALVQEGGSGDHADLIARSNARAALWIQGPTTSFHVHGTATDIGGNGLAGIGGVAASHVTIEDAHVYGSHTAMLGSTMLGDGIHLAGTVDEVTLQNVVVENNARVQILADAGDPTHAVSTLALTHVSVNGTGTQLGCIHQNGMFGATWDSGVMRSGVTTANDAAFTSTLAVASTIATLPNADAITTGGLAAIR